MDRYIYLYCVMVNTLTLFVFGWEGKQLVCKYDITQEEIFYQKFFFSTPNKHSRTNLILDIILLFDFTSGFLTLFVINFCHTF